MYFWHRLSSILDAEKSVVNILKRITHNTHSNPIKWKTISPGSIKLVFVLMTSDISIAYSSESLHKVFQESGIIKMCIDDRIFYDLQVSNIAIYIHSKNNLVKITKIVIVTHCRNDTLLSKKQLIFTIATLMC